MSARSHGGLFVVCLDNLAGSAKENLAATLSGAKFVQALPMTGMVGDILPMEAPGHPALRFVRLQMIRRYRPRRAQLYVVSCSD